MLGGSHKYLYTYKFSGPTKERVDGKAGFLAVGNLREMTDDGQIYQSHLI